MIQLLETPVEKCSGPLYFSTGVSRFHLYKKAPGLRKQVRELFSATAQVIPSGTDPLMLPGGPGQL